MKKTTTLLLLALAAINARGQELIVNGDFETDAVAAGSYLYVTNGNGNTITGWTLEDVSPGTTDSQVARYGDVDLVGESVTLGWVGTTESQCVDLHGLDKGELSQTVATTIGTDYLVSFKYSWNTDGQKSSFARSAMLEVGAWDDLEDEYVERLQLTPMWTQFFVRGSTYTNDVTVIHSRGWHETNFTFTATQSSHKLRLVGGGYPWTSGGPMIDDVSVTAVP